MDKETLKTIATNVVSEVIYGVVDLTVAPATLLNEQFRDRWISSHAYNSLVDGTTPGLVARGIARLLPRDGKANFDSAIENALKIHSLPRPGGKGAK